MITKTNHLTAGLEMIGKYYYVDMQYYSDQDIVSKYKASNKMFFNVKKTKTTQIIVFENTEWSKYNNLKNEEVKEFKLSDKQCQIQSKKVKKYKKCEIKHVTMNQEIFDLNSNTVFLLDNTLNSSGKRILNNIQHTINNSETPAVIYIYFAKDNKDGTYYIPLVYKVDNFDKFKKSKKEQRQSITISVPCESKDIAKVVYKKYTYQYCVDNKGNKTLIYTNEETFAADLPISDEIDKLQQQLSRLQIIKDNVNALIVDLNEQKNEIEKELYGDSDYLKQIKKEKDEIDSIVNELSDEHNKIFAQLQKIWKDRDTEQANIESYQNQINSIYNNAGSVLTQEEGKKIRQLYDKKEASQKKLTELQAKNETLGKKFDENYKKLQQLQKQQDNMWNLLEQAQKRENEQNDKLTKQLHEIQDYISKNENEISQLDNEISSVNDKIAQLNKDLDNYQIKQLLGLKDQHTQTKSVWYVINYHVDSRDLTNQNYQKQLKKFNEAYQNGKNLDKEWRHQDGVNACKKKCKEPGCFELGSGQSNNKQFMAKLKAKAAQYKKDYPEKDYNSVIRQTGGNTSYNDQNSISQYDYQSKFIICFTCKNEYLSQ